MTGARSYDALVIGAGTNGLAAATYLAMAGKRVLVVEARDTIGGLCETATFGEGFLFSKAAHALYALDARLTRELNLARYGLKFAVRDMPLAGLRADGNHVLISRDGHATARNIALQSGSDAAAWPQFRREWYGLGRKLRALWWDACAKTPDELLRNGNIRRLAGMGAAAWLDSWFESDALKATLGFDARALSPLASGSTLLLLWRAAQEMCGLQGAVALPRGGLRTVADALAGSAKSAGAEIRTNAPVADILLDAQGAARGVLLRCGETIAAPLVLSSLSREHTLTYPSLASATGFSQAAALRMALPALAAARVTFALSARPEINGIAVPETARLVLVDRLDSLATAHAAALSGQIPRDLPIEVTMPAFSDPALVPAGHHILSALVSPLPASVHGGWKSLKPVLAARVIEALGRHMPGLASHLEAVEVLTPEDVGDVYGAEDSLCGTRRMLADWRVRVRTPVAGLLLCGASADPVGAVSGRGGRVAAAYAFAEEART